MIYNIHFLYSNNNNALDVELNVLKFTTVSVAFIDVMACLQRPGECYILMFARFQTLAVVTLLPLLQLAAVSVEAAARLPHRPL